MFRLSTIEVRMQNFTFLSTLLFAVILTYFPSKVITLEETEECGLVNSNLLRNTNKVTEIDEFPWIGRLAYSNVTRVGTVFLCQAVLITQRYMITVAHCLGALHNLEPYAVLLGDWDSSNDWSDQDCEQVSGKCSTPMMIDIEEIVVNSNFDWNKHINDIGLLRLNQTVTSSDFIRPICLPDKNDIKMEFDSKQLMLTGWLRRAWGFRQKMSVSIFKRDVCRSIYNEHYRFNITESHVCGIACDDNVSFLSSSALMDVKNEETQSSKVYLVGVISYRTLKCIPGVPDLFTRVDRYLDWVQHNIIP